MRLRDHDKGDLALTALTLVAAAAAAVSETVQWVGRRRRRSRIADSPKGPGDRQAFTRCPQ